MVSSMLSVASIGLIRFAVALLAMAQPPHRFALFFGT
jgi:hypothetical protein